MKKKKMGFTLVELLAVVVLLTVMIAIAIPKITDVVNNSTKATFESSAKTIASSAEKRKMENEILENTKTISCNDVVNINDEDYSSCTITFDGNTAKVSMLGSGKFKGLLITDGTKDDAVAKVGEYFTYTGAVETFTAPQTGYYKLEVWGAQGGGDTSFPGGYGGYSSGIYYLKKRQKLYINVGSAGEYSTGDAIAAGGYNGGGNGGCDNDNRYGYCGGGGGATHIATKSGLLSIFSSNQSALLIVAGGGGGRGGNGNSSYGNAGSAAGGAGGGITGSSGPQIIGNQNGTGGSQTSGGTGSVAGSFGQGANDNSINSWGRGGGGGGFYGGGSGFRSSGAGGSGYIGNSLLTDKVMYCYNCTESTDTDTKTISTTCTNDAAVSNCSKQGNGYAKILYIEE